MELTHFERVMKQVLPYDSEGRAFAQKTVSKEKPEDLFVDFLNTEKVKVHAHARTTEEFVRSLTPFSSKMLSITHHLTQEFMRKQVNKGSLTELTKNMTIGKILSIGTQSTDDEVLNSVGHMHYHMAAHRMAGRVTWDVGPGLAEKLKNTELRGLTADDLKLPVQSLYIMIPREAELEIYNNQSDWHRAIGLYVSEDVDEGGHRCWRFLVCGEPKPREVLPGIIDDNDALVYFHVPLPAKMPLIEAVAKAQEDHVKDVNSLKRRHHIDSFTKMLDKWEGIFRWTMNVILYSSLESVEKEDVIANEEARKLVEQMNSLPKGSKKRHRIGGRLSQMQQCRRTVFGRSIIVQRGGWTLTVRVLVTGHWRNQPFGPGSMYRRLQWIEPFWRGPDVAEVAATTPEVAPAAQGAGGTDDTRNGKSDHEVGGTRSAPTDQDDQRADGGDEGCSQPKASNA